MNVLYGRETHGPLERYEEFKTYGAAVTTGQQIFGYGNFLVETGERCPTRDEQLLKTKNTRQERLESL